MTYNLGWMEYYNVIVLFYKHDQTNGSLTWDETRNARTLGWREGSTIPCDAGWVMKNPHFDDKLCPVNTWSRKYRKYSLHSKLCRFDFFGT